MVNFLSCAPSGTCVFPVLHGASWRRCVLALAGLVGLGALSACGGGSQGYAGNRSGEPLVMLAGTSLAVPGEIETATDLLKTMGWRLLPQDMANPDLQLKNASCDAALKLDRVSPAPANVSTDPITSGSTWRCTLLVAASVNPAATTSYTLLLQGVDTAGRQITHTRLLQVLPNPALAVQATAPPQMLVSVAGSLLGQPGQALNLGAVASWAGNTPENAAPPQAQFAWSLGAGAPADAYLLSPASATAQLVLPKGVVTPLVIPVRVTATAAGLSASTEVAVLVDPFSPMAPSVNPPVQLCSPGAMAVVQAEDIDIRDPNLFFQWSVLEGPEVSLGGGNTFFVGFIAPDVQTTTRIRLQLAVGYQPISTASPGAYFVDAWVEVRPTVDGAGTACVKPVPLEKYR